MQEQSKQSESIVKIAGALVEIQGNGLVVSKDSTGHNYKYASLDALVEKVMPMIARHGLSIVQILDSVDGHPALRTILLHNSGEWISGTYPLEKAGMRQVNDAQQFGAAITYARRYGIMSLLGIAAGDDDAACLTQKKDLLPSEDEMGPDPGPLPKRHTKKADIWKVPAAELSRDELKDRIAKYTDKMFDLEKDMFKQSWKDADHAGLVSVVQSVENRIAKEG